MTIERYFLSVGFEVLLFEFLEFLELGSSSARKTRS